MAESQPQPQTGSVAVASAAADDNYFPRQFDSILDIDGYESDFFKTELLGLILPSAGTSSCGAGIPIYDSLDYEFPTRFKFEIDTSGSQNQRLDATSDELMGESDGTESHSPPRAEQPTGQNATPSVAAAEASQEAVGEHCDAPAYTIAPSDNFMAPVLLAHSSGELQPDSMPAPLLNPMGQVENIFGDSAPFHHPFPGTSTQDLPLDTTGQALTLDTTGQALTLDTTGQALGVMAMDSMGQLNGASETIDPIGLGAIATPATQIRSAFAKLKFEKEDFYMTTYSVELGRLSQEEERKREGDHQRNPRKRKWRRTKSTNSYSEKGGISHGGGAPWGSKNSYRSGSPTANPRDLLHTPHDEYNAMSTNDEAVPVNASQYQSDPNHCPKIPLFPPPRKEKSGDSEEGDLKEGKLQSLSRSHAFIRYNFESGNFDIEAIGRNGLFIERVDNPLIYLRPPMIRSLQHGDHLQIGGVQIIFQLPSIEPDTPFDDETEDEEMNLTFENIRGESMAATGDGLESESEDTQIHSLPQWDDSELYGDDSDEEEESEPAKPVRKPRNDQPRTKKLSIKIPKKKIAKDESLPKSKQRVTKKTKSVKRGIGGRKKAQQLHNEAEEAPAAPSSTDKGKAKVVHKESDKENKDILPSVELKQESPTSKQLMPQDTDKDSFLFKAVPLQGTNSTTGTMRYDDPEELKRLGLPPDTVFKRKSGPGRPPKDGVMSKREKAILAKLCKEREKAIKDGRDPEEITLQSIQNATNKSASRPTQLSADLVGSGAVGSSEVAATTPVRRNSRPEKMEEPASPALRREDYTVEQLLKPSLNYVQILWEVLSEAKDNQLPLQSIYRAIKRKYPWYHFGATSKGWESSVRHNLLSCESFTKIEIGPGKTNQNWTIDKTKPIQKATRRPRPATPPQHQQHQQSQHQVANPSHTYGYPHNIPQYQAQHGQRPQMAAYSPPSHPPHLAIPTARLPSSLLGPSAPQAPASTPTGSYVSPWTSGGSSAPPPASPYGPAPTHRSPYGPPPPASPYANQPTPQQNHSQLPPNTRQPPPQVYTPPSMIRPVPASNEAPRSYTPPGPAPGIRIPQSLMQNGTAAAGTSNVNTTSSNHPSAPSVGSSSAQGEQQPVTQQHDAPRPYSVPPPQPQQTPQAQMYRPPQFPHHSSYAGSSASTHQPAPCPPSLSSAPNGATVDSPKRPDVEPLTPQDGLSRPSTSHGDRDAASTNGVGINSSGLRRQLEAAVAQENQDAVRDWAKTEPAAAALAALLADGPQPMEGVEASMDTGTAVQAASTEQEKEDAVMS